MSDYLPIPTGADSRLLLEQLESKREETYELLCELLQQPEIGSLDLGEYAVGGARRWFIEKLQSLLNSPPAPDQVLLADRLLGLLSENDEHGTFFTSLVKTSLNSPHLDRWLPEIVRWGNQVTGAGREVRDLLIGLTLRRLLAHPNTGSYALLTQAAGAVAVDEDTFALDALLKLASQFVQVRQKAADEVHAQQEEVETLRGKLQETRSAYAQVEREMMRARREAEDGLLQSLFAALAPALTQLPTLRAQKGSGKRLKAADWLSLFGHIERALWEQGFEPLGEVGQLVPFDPQFHIPMEREAEIEPGETIRVRFVGYRYREQIIRRALVSRP